MSFYDYGYYETKAEKKRRIDEKLERLRKDHLNINPVIVEGKVLAHSWWGKAWGKNLESYADFKSRLSRGKNYVKQGAVLDLKIEAGQVFSKISGSGSKIYDCEIHIEKLSKDCLKKVTDHCQNKIATLEALLSGEFSEDLLLLFQDKSYGLFPSPDEIRFSCNCPDVAHMCKHIAASLYAIGAKFDDDPLLFFTLRQIESEHLIQNSVEKKLENMLKNAGKKTNRSIDIAQISDIFGL